MVLIVNEAWHLLQNFEIAREVRFRGLTRPFLELHRSHLEGFRCVRAAIFYE